MTHEYGADTELAHRIAAIAAEQAEDPISGDLPSIDRAALWFLLGLSCVAGIVLAVI